MKYDDDSPFEVVEDKIHKLTYRCPCGNVFSVDATTSENLKWDKKKKLWYGVCPSCGLEEGKTNGEVV